MLCIHFPPFFLGETLRKFVHFIGLLKESARGLIHQFYQKQMQNLIMRGFRGGSNGFPIRQRTSPLVVWQFNSSFLQKRLKFLKTLFELVLQSKWIIKQHVFCCSQTRGNLTVFFLSSPYPGFVKVYDFSWKFIFLYQIHFLYVES